MFLATVLVRSSSVAKLLPVPRKLRVGITNERGARLENGRVALEERGVDDRLIRYRPSQHGRERILVKFEPSGLDRRVSNSNTADLERE